MTKLNLVLASLGKEDFPDSGKQLFGDGFESRSKFRSETANTVADAKKDGKSFFSWHSPPKVPWAFSGWQRSIQNPLPRLRSPHIKLSDHKHIIQGQEQSPIYPVPRAISTKTTSIVPVRPSHLSSGMFRNFLNFPNNLPQAGRLKHFFISMGTDYKGPLGPPSSLWLSNRVSRQSCTTKHRSSYPMFIGPSNHNRSGGLGTVIKRGSPFRSTQLSTGTGIHQLPFCNTQKGWGPLASDKSKTPKLFHPIRTL